MTEPKPASTTEIVFICIVAAFALTVLACSVQAVFVNEPLRIEVLRVAAEHGHVVITQNGDAK